MANSTITHYPANLTISSQSANQSAPMVPSFTNSDNSFDNKSSFFPDYGPGAVNQFTSNTTYSELSNTYAFSKGGIWNSNRDAGFIVRKNTASMVEFNLRIISSPGHFIPAPMLNGFSFLEYHPTGLNSNWRTRRLALEFRNWDTGEIRYYAPNWDNSTEALIQTKFRNMSAAEHWNVIRSWGREWVLYGAVFNIRSNSTSATQSPTMHLYSTRCAWQTTGLTGTTRWIPTKYQSWNDFSTQMKEGTPVFETN